MLTNKKLQKILDILRTRCLLDLYILDNDRFFKNETDIEQSDFILEKRKIRTIFNSLNCYGENNTLEQEDLIHIYNRRIKNIHTAQDFKDIHNEIISFLKDGFNGEKINFNDYLQFVNEIESMEYNDDTPMYSDYWLFDSKYNYIDYVKKYFEEENNN